MTARKPANRSYSDWIEDQIREAQERGEFDDLPGKGKPLKGLDGPQDDLWWVKQWLAREGVSYLPVPLALRLEAEKLVDGLDRLSSEQSVRKALDELNGRIRHANRMPAIDGPPTTLMPLDVEQLVERWRSGRATMGNEPLSTAETPDAANTPSDVDARTATPRRWWRRR
ncbi:MAG: hypothetical protein AVDCRST_MAG50-3276 [uncultured Acidimicrobiales bacterium]|uniref:DnaJ homologue subfamily C member 28 conserved domain-containing protein n=1 Tax=uncultured Acidimicrobiales bacterium TaxID=310071 RepID=A0A6J4J286_9ACTN|nr:MAG: hypothetical protein AVDCRST_MAG50-3276 [uncultured Acidimicrobiales bacterium]